ncbi:MAG: rhodanese-like domain-containing protein [Brevinemataceae bacterium]
MKKVIVLCILCFTSCSSAWKAYVKISYEMFDADKITTHDELKYIICTVSAKRYIIADLRIKEQFEKSRIKYAVSIPYHAISNITNISEYQNKHIIFYDFHKTDLHLIKKELKKLKIELSYSYLQPGFKELTNTNLIETGNRQIL